MIDIYKEFLKKLNCRLKENQMESNKQKEQTERNIPPPHKTNKKTKELN